MKQFDIKEFAQMFDAALASDNPAVKKALRNFMMVAAIVHAEEQTGEERLMGPLETLVKKVADLEAIVYKMQERIATKDYYKDKYYKDYYNNPTWVYSPNTSGTISGTSVDKVWYDEATDIADLLKDLKIT
jgi:hypothetical protein